MGAAEAIEALYQVIQKACLPGVWSRGVALTRENAVIADTFGPGEIRLRVRAKDRPVSPQVTLWPGPEADDVDWHCDCGDRNDVCAHVAAAVIAVKAGRAVPETPGEAPAAQSGAPRLAYRFSRLPGGALGFERVIIHKEREQPLTETLVAFVGGISSGRIAFPTLSATREDFAVDAALGPARRGPLEHELLIRLLGVLQNCTNLTLDGQPISASGKATGLGARLTDDGEGFRLAARQDPLIRELFTNGAALCEPGVLRPLADPGLSPAEKDLLSGAGRHFAPREAAWLVSEVIPALERKLPLELVTRRLPRLESVEPKAVLELETEADGALSVLPTVIYPTRPGAVSPRDDTAERLLARRLQQELHLTPGQRVRLEGQAAVDFTARLQGWETTGRGQEAFAIQGELAPRISFGAEPGAFALAFKTASGKSADPEKVFRAWRENETHVPLLGGGWAPLPRDWLERFGPRLSALLAARAESPTLPPCRLPELASLCAETGDPVPPALDRLRRALETFDGIPAATLPGDLRASLRAYQKTGVDWLAFLRDTGMGAMLADDMGLGKTLQAMCALRGRTLVVLPTSVLESWAGQLAEFRPGLKVSRYYGPGRALDPRADVTLTTYALLRLDREALTRERWDTVILDEAQTIKNPDSQIAQAAHQLRGDFRIALSGTPVENRLDDLWSQFQFLNPGLLGSQRDFQDAFGLAVTRGDAEATRRLRERLRPFILRRLKREVAPELPPKTETVLHCELGTEEQELYDSLLAGARREVVAQLEAGGGIFAALEILLRLRQASCHPALVPGNTAETSSKVELLLTSLENSLALGHRALVFSQWTRFLDLLEPRLAAAGIGFLRLDGATRDRQAVVEKFQAADGPPVFLISLKAGGLGLTLTAADHIYLLDPWWNPAVEDQAADRAHRIGQENPVLVHRLVARGTVEDRILTLQKRKLALAGAVLEGAGQAGAMTREDLMALLA